MEETYYAVGSIGFLDCDACGMIIASDKKLFYKEAHSYLFDLAKQYQNENEALDDVLSELAVWGPSWETYECIKKNMLDEYQIAELDEAIASGKPFSLVF